MTFMFRSQQIDNTRDSGGGDGSRTRAAPFCFCKLHIIRKNRKDENGPECHLFGAILAQFSALSTTTSDVSRCHITVARNLLRQQNSGARRSTRPCSALMRRPPFKPWIVSISSCRSRRDAPNDRMAKRPHSPSVDGHANLGTPNGGQDWKY
jgi:hypothetical protein